MTRDRRGFSLLELLTVLVVISLVVGLALPQYHLLRSRAVAAQAIGATQVVRNAAYAHMEATGSWPSEAAAGRIPGGLVRFLPTGFRFTHAGFSLAWRHTTWLTPDGTQSAQMTQVLTDDPAVCDAVHRLLGGRRNPDLLAACNGSVGLVTWYYDN
jgi:prepilin-type N-terminal cleavage/methylation domain-containing protein